MSGKIYITGDCHNNFSKFNTEYFPIQKQLDKDDYIIICGDFGGIWSNEESKQEKWNLKWLDDHTYTTLFIDGNHENFDRLAQYPLIRWHGGLVHEIRPTVLHLMRGQVYNICNKIIFCMGGATSIDISGGILEPDDPEIKSKKRQLDEQGQLYRINHITWWQQEMPSKSEYNTALFNLRTVNYKVDYIITHCGSNSTLDELELSKKQKNELTDFLETIKNKVEYTKWYLGHYHKDININKKEVILYHHIVELGNQIPDNISIIGQPKYKLNQAVRFNGRIGIIDIIDAYGTFSQPYEPSYDIRSFQDKDICIFQHNKESDVKPLSESELALYADTINILRN